jgi:hypothetical protein
MGVSTSVANAVLNFTLKGSYLTYVSLHTAAPQTGDAHEIFGLGYQRELIAGTDWTTPANALSSTAVAVTFPTAGSAWGTVTHVGLYDSPSGGTLLWWGAIVTPRVVGAGETLSFSSGGISGAVL